MNVSLYHAASALNATDRWQEMIAQNLASSGVPGYKKQEISFSAVQAGQAIAGPAPVSGTFQLPQARAVTSFQAGELRYTGSPTDAAIDGRGFFEVQLPNGTSAFTRDGEFRWSAQGQLVTKQGYAVLGDGGPIQLDLDNPAPLSIAATGEVSQGVDMKGRLRITEFNDPSLLKPLSGGLFLGGDPGLAGREAAESTVRQGWIEGANTSVVGEMANLITAMRTFEANQRLIQMHDERMSRVISDLGTPN
ncbi:MAG: flagellar hook-basal body protein [Verrucomicrobiae bacterium]|nr:flagellar hook-basal body protein [Verrucomicrobiae bacterium]